MKIDLTFQQQRYSQIAVVFGNIILCVYSRRFRGEELSNYIWVIENVDFQGFRCYVFGNFENQAKAILLSPFHWSQNTWPWMTLNGLNGHFTLYFHLRYAFEYYLLFVTYLPSTVSKYRSVHVTSGKRSTGLWSAEYLESTGKVQIFLELKNSTLWYSITYCVIVFSLTPNMWLWMTWKLG